MLASKVDKSAESRIKFITKELEWLKALKHEEGKNHYRKFEHYFKQKNRWLPFFIGSNRTYLEKRILSEKPIEVIESFFPKSNEKQILADALNQILLSPSQPPPSALNIFDWAWPDKAIEYYQQIYNSNSENDTLLKQLEAKFREGIVRNSLSHSNFLLVIEDSAKGGLVKAMLYAARKYAEISDSNPQSALSALFWYWRINRHQSLDFLLEVYPKKKFDFAEDHRVEKYFMIGSDLRGCRDEANKFEQKVMKSSPKLLFDWYLSMQERDPLFKTKIGTFYFSDKRKGVRKNIDKGLEHLSAAADQGEHNAVLFLAKYYYEKCQYLFKGKANKENFFKWAKTASTIRISPHGNFINSNMANAYGHYYLAYAYLKGIGCEKDKERQKYHLEKSARSGYTKAGETLAKGYETGMWEKKSQWKAFAWYKWSNPKNTRSDKILDNIKNDPVSLAKANELLKELTLDIGNKRFSSLTTGVDTGQ